MPITLSDKDLKELESVRDPNHVSRYFWLRYGLSEASTGTTLPYFDEEKARKYILYAAPDTPCGKEQWAGNYYRNTVPPIGATLVIHFDDVVSVVFDNDAATGGYKLSNNDAAASGNIAANWHLSPLGLLAGIPPRDTRSVSAALELQKAPMVLSRRKEVEWLSSNARELGNYEGQWIAIEGNEVVARGSDEVEVEMRAREKGIKVPLLVRIPSKDDMPFVGFSLYDSNNIQ